MNVPIDIVEEYRNITDSSNIVVEVEVKEETNAERDGRNLLGLFPVFLILLMVVLKVSWSLYKSFGQKTRNAPQRRGMYAGSRQRPSLTAQEPTIYVSPSNMPPPPKYEYMAPPSYEEVVGIHYPNYQVQPIAQPINTALAQSSSYATNTTESPVVTTVNETAHAAPATTAGEPRRTSVAVTR